MIKHFSVELSVFAAKIIDIFPAESDDRAVRIELFDDEIERFKFIWSAHRQ